MTRHTLRLQRLEDRLAPAIITWDGGGADALWTNPINWLGDVAPTPNATDTLVFPAGAARLTNTNDFPAGSRFTLLDFRGPDYVIGGNALVLTNGIMTNAATPIDPANFPRLTLPIAPAVDSLPLSGNANLGVVLDGPVTTVITSGNVAITGRYTLNGVVSGPGGVTTNVGADAVLTGNNTYTGGTGVSGGTLRVDGTLVANGFTSVSGFGNPTFLRGSGAVGNLFLGESATLDPGTAGPGTLRASQFALVGVGTFNVDVNGTAAGTFDQLVANQVELNGRLVLNIGGTHISPGERLRIIDNGGSEPVSGTFSNLPEGAVVVVGDRIRYTITYVGGDGNDVELLTTPGPPLFTWDGGGADDNWTTAANWVGDVAPTAGVALAFPAGAARTTNTNDFAVGTAFDNIVVAPGYQLNGNAVMPTNGIAGANAPAAGGGAAVNLDITLAAPQSFATDSTPFALTLSGAVNLNGFTLSTNGTGVIVLNGTVSGAGGITQTAGGLTLTSGLTLNGNNTYTGLTDVRSGTLTLGTSNALGATGTGNDTRIEFGTLTLVNQGGVQLVSPEAITFGSQFGSVSINAVSGTAAPATLSGPLTLIGGAFSATTTPGPLVFAGPLTGSGNLFVSNLTIAASSISPAYTGRIASIVQVDGQLPAALFTPGVLSGTGRVGVVDVIAGTVSPGGSGGLDVGTLSTGNLTIRPGIPGRFPVPPGIYRVDVTAAGADRINMTGTVSLGGSLELNFAPGFVPTIGTRYRIIDNDGTDAVGFPFLGASEGGIVATSGNVSLRITFRGGDFNDVELVAGPSSRRIAVGAGAGGGPVVRVFDESTNLVRQFLAYDSNFRGGVRVAQGDFTGDGADEIVTAAGIGGGPHVRVWDGATGALLNEFFAYAANFTGGVNVAVGDVTGDGTLDIVTGPDFGGGPHVRVFARNGTVIGEFFAYNLGFRGGVTVATGNVNGANGDTDDIVTGAGRTGGSHVKVFTSANGQLQTQFFAFDGFFGGVNVAVVNTGVAVTPMAGGGPIVRLFTAPGALVNQFIAYPADFRGGVTLTGSDVDGDGVEDIVTGPGPGGGPIVAAFTPTGVQRRGFFAFDPAFLGGIFVG